MTRDEFTEWGEDLRARLPAVGDYVWKLDKRSRDIWFDEIFSAHDLRDCMQLNYRLFRGELELPPKYDWDNLPRFISRQLIKIQSERLESEGKHRDKPYIGDAKGSMEFVTGNAFNGRVFRRLLESQADYRSKHNGEYMPDWKRHQELNRIWEEEESQPTVTKGQR